MEKQAPSGWIYVDLNSIAKIEWGNTALTKKSYTDGGYITYSATGPDGFLPNFGWVGEGIVLSAIGAQCGKCFWASGQWNSIKNTIVIQSSLGAETTKFLYYLLNGQSNWYLSGSGQPFITLKTAKEKEICLPPLNEQRRIVAKIEELFSELDNGIAALKTAREQLKVYRQAILKHAFEGKLTAKWREENPDKLETPEQLLARIQEERDARFEQQLEEWKATVKEWEARGKVGKKPGKPSKPTMIREIQNDILPTLPKGWCWVEYAGICEQIRNGISAKPSGEYGTKIFRISAVRAMEFSLEDIRYLKNDDGQFDEYFLGKGDLVFTRYNGTRDYVGVCAEYRGDGTHLYPDKLIQTRLAVKSISPSYLEKAINCGGSRRFIELRIRTTAGQSGISGGDVKSMPVPVCSVEEQIIIEEHIAEQLSHIATMNADIDSGITRAEILRQSILKKAFSGKLVPQDSNDESASQLLVRIKATKPIGNDK
ncbi:TPA: restriction endonuclease subunit S [Legionella pneumophila]|nr:restriction endonuclease [Legionella pneumophila]HAT6933091.1 restriction endonuclease [Legionella pneumophila]HAT7744806.1 restriction endonuclease [Legionella pneumophila]HAT7820633.1 restriction endonuclease [Legionella pneumophila]HAT7931016.1 restriction endonuclease [Legionella pneumophila]